MSDGPWGRADLMVTAAVRYCLGRSSYIVGDCVDWLVANWQAFSPNCRAIVVRDLNLTVMPERLRIDESTVQIPEHGFEQHSYLRPHARTPIGAFTLAAFHCTNRMRQP